VLLAESALSIIPAVAGGFHVDRAGGGMAAAKLVIAYAERGLTALFQIKITVSHCFEPILL